MSDINELQEWYKELEDKGHELILDEYGSIDIWVLDYDYHNGPGCAKCGISWCHHCMNEITECVEE